MCRATITYLSGIEQPLELLHELGALVAARLWVEEDEDGADVGRHGLDAEGPGGVMLLRLLLVMLLLQQLLSLLLPLVLVGAVLEAGLEVALAGDLHDPEIMGNGIQ